MTGINTKQIFVNHLSYGKTFFIVYTEKEGVVLPDHLMAESEAKLTLSKDFDTTVFKMDATKLQVDLSFGGQKFLCTIPFNSIYYIAMAHSPFDGTEIQENAPESTLELVKSLKKLIQSTTVKPKAPSLSLKKNADGSKSKEATITTEEDLLKEKKKESFQNAVVKSFAKILNDLDEGRFDMDKMDFEPLTPETDDEKEIDLSNIALKNETRH